MATITSSHKLFPTNIAPSIAKGKREHVSCDAIIRPVKHVRKGETGSTPQQNSLDASVVLRKHKDACCRTTYMTPRRGNSYMVIEASNNTEKHLQSLDSYLGKLHHDVKQPSSKILLCFSCRGVLASINIAVLLFEIATPVRNSDFELLSLPLLYGAKINNLILTGEWWRLVTPMFLVQD